MGKAGRTNSSIISVIIFLLLFAATVITPQGARGEDAANEDELFEDELLFEEEEDVTISDPLEPLNRAFFHFNDKLYFWVLKPVSTGYKYVVAEDIRGSFGNFFDNLLGPIRIVNTLLQGKFKQCGTETGRFFINTTIGVAGFGDPAKKEFDMVTSDEDFGQTLGKWGIGDGIYLVLPFRGPSNARDTVGLVGDAVLYPTFWLGIIPGLATRAADTVNSTSFRLGEYEQFKEASFDPYVALRDAYQQYRRSQIKDDAEASKPAYSSSLEEQEKDADQVQKVAGLNYTMRDRRIEGGLDREDFYTDLGPFVDLTQEYKLYVVMK